jgi:hypothetical protein
VKFTLSLPLTYIPITGLETRQDYGKAQNNSEERKLWITPNYMIGSQNSSVSIATNDGIDKPGFDSRKGKDIFFSQKCPN